MSGACCTYAERRCAYWVLVGRPEGKRLLGRLGHRKEDNIKMIKMDQWEVGWVTWTGLIWLKMGTGGRILLMQY